MKGLAFLIACGVAITHLLMSAVIMPEAKIEVYTPNHPWLALTLAFLGVFVYQAIKLNEQLERRNRISVKRYELTEEEAILIENMREGEK